MNGPRFIHSSVSGHMGCSYLLTTVNSAAVGIGEGTLLFTTVQRLWWFISECCPPPMTSRNASALTTEPKCSQNSQPGLKPDHFLCSQAEKVVLCNEESKGKIQGWIGIKASSIHAQKNLQHVQVSLFLRLCGFRILNTQLLTQSEIWVQTAVYKTGQLAAFRKLKKYWCLGPFPEILKKKVLNRGQI